MADLFRFGISLPRDLIEKFDGAIRGKSYTNRSKAIGDLIRQELTRKEWREDREIAGAVILIYNHRKKELFHKITHLQDSFRTIIISAEHIYLDRNHCLEIIAIKGNSLPAQNLTNSLRAIKGIKRVMLSMADTGPTAE